MYAVIRLEKYKRFAVFGIGKERNRTTDDNRNFKNSIDKTRTEFNHTLKKCDDFNREISNQIKYAGVKERPDSIVMIGAVYTASDEFFTPNPKYIELTPEQYELISSNKMKDPRDPEQRQKYLFDEKTKSYFYECARFHIERFCQGDKNRVISAKIDFDEDTPHMQIYSVPLEKRIDKNGNEKMHLSAKTIIGNRTDLRKMQDDFYQKIGEPRGFIRGDKVDWDKSYEERKKHESSYEFNKRQREKLIKEQEQKLLEQQNELERNKKQIIKQAEAAEALTKSKIKRNGLFNKDNELIYKMDMADYQRATSQVSAINKVLDSPIYSDKDLKDMQRATEAARQSKSNYEQKLAEINKLIEERAKELISLQNMTEPIKIRQLEQKLMSKTYELEELKRAIESYMYNNHQSIELFERSYGVSLHNSIEDNERAL